MLIFSDGECKMDDVRITTLANDIAAVLDARGAGKRAAACDPASVSKSADLVHKAKAALDSEIRNLGFFRVLAIVIACGVMLYALTRLVEADPGSSWEPQLQTGATALCACLITSMLLLQNEKHTANIRARVSALYSPASTQCSAAPVKKVDSILTVGATSTAAEKRSAVAPIDEDAARSGLARTDTVYTTVGIARVVDIMAAMTGMSFFREMDDWDIDGVVRRVIAPALIEARSRTKAQLVPDRLRRPVGAGAGAECEVSCGDRVDRLTAASKKGTVVKADVDAAWLDCDSHMRSMCDKTDDAAARCALGCNDNSRSEVTVFHITDSVPDTSSPGAWDVQTAGDVRTAVEVSDHLRKNLKTYDAGMIYRTADKNSVSIVAFHRSGGTADAFRTSPGASGTVVKAADSLLHVPEADPAAVAKGILRSMMGMKSVFDVTPQKAAVLSAILEATAVKSLDAADKEWYEKALTALAGSTREASSALHVGGKMPDITAFEERLTGMTLREFVTTVAHPVIKGVFLLEARHACVTQTVSNFPYVIVTQGGTLGLLVALSAGLAFSLARPFYSDSEHRRSFAACCGLLLALAVAIVLVWMKRSHREVVQARGVKDANGRTLIESARALRAHIIKLAFGIEDDDCQRLLAGVQFNPQCAGSEGAARDVAISRIEAEALIRSMRKPPADTALGCFPPEDRERLLALLVDTLEAVDACNFVSARLRPSTIPAGEVLFFLIVACAAFGVLARLFTITDVRGTVLDIREANALRRAVLDGEGPTAARSLAKFLESRQLQAVDYGMLVSLGFAITAVLTLLCIFVVFTEYNNVDREAIATCAVKSRRAPPA